jgi:hypothetical protein
MNLVMAANRGPFQHVRSSNGGLEFAPAEGGVATALRSAASFNPTTILCSPMTEGDRVAAAHGQA